MGSPAIFSGSRTKLLSSKGLLLKDGTTIDNDGKVEFIKNGKGALGTTGWTEGSYTAATRPSGTFTASSGSSRFEIGTTVLNPLGTGTTSFRFIKTAGVNEQGRAIETSFALPLSYRAKVLQIEVDYIIAAGTFVAGSSTTDSSLIWYCAFSNDNGSTYTVAEPSSFKMLSNSTTVSDKFTASIQTPYNATHMKLIAYVAETATTSWEVVAITSVSPSEYVYGTPITDTSSYTPVWTASTTNPAIGNGSINGMWRRNGDHMEGSLFLAAGSTTTFGSGTYYFSLPSGYSIDASKVPSGTVVDDDLRVGFGSILDFGVTRYPLFVTVNSATTLKLNTMPDASTGYIQSNSTVTNTVPFTFGNADVIEFNFKVPILGWSSSVQMSDGYDGRVVAFASTGSTSSITGTVSTSYITPTTVLFDDVSSFSGNTYTVKSSGKYRASVYASGGSVAYSAGQYFGVGVTHNATDYTLGNKRVDAAITATQQASGSYVFNCVAGDTLKFYAVSSVNQTLGDAKLSIEKLSGSPTISATETVSLYAKGTGADSIGISSDSLIKFTTVDDSTHGAYSTSTGIFTAPIAGRYNVAWSVAATLILSETQRITSLLYKNGAEYAVGDYRQGDSVNQTHNSAGALTGVYLNAGDTLAIYALSSVATTALASTSFNYFTVTKV